ncbi:hypothetical protein C8R44DRAFT_887644 [Mycena epipterygia]|nr:hypothetical protein C8R44DRAFT_887644 [Mycena epipterygia]
MFAPTTGSTSPSTNILFRPVTTEADFLYLARAAGQLVICAVQSAVDYDKLSTADIKSSQQAHGCSDLISIRFKLHEKACTFISLVQHYLPLAGQHASFRDVSEMDNGSHGRGESNQALLDALCGGVHQTSPRSMYNSLRIIAWNVKGDFAVKITGEVFIKRITFNDIIIFQETWLR